MANPKVSLAAAKDMLNQLTAQLDAGGSAGKIEIYDGTQPGAVTDAPNGTLLAELTLSNPAFGDATDDGAGNAQATSNSITSDSSANASGTASWFRSRASDGTAVIDGDVSTDGNGGDLQLGSTSISAGAEVAVSSWVLKMPTSS